jgi:hypothetical protein
MWSPERTEFYLKQLLKKNNAACSRMFFKSEQLLDRKFSEIVDFALLRKE